jgi:hypothetical protein
MIIGLILVLIGVALGYGFRGSIGRLLNRAKTLGSSTTATAKLDAAKAKADALKDAVAVQKTVVADIHTDIDDLHKAL